MKHITLDCYGASQHSLNNLTIIYQLLNELAYEYELEPIAPPHLIPYYYGRVKEDSGISAYVLLKGGHITIHTFPIRECYFIDVFTMKDVNEDEIYEYFLDNLPFSKKNSNFEVINRIDNTFDMLPYSSDIDFGPHLMTKIESNKEQTMESIFDFLEKIVIDINMDPIIRACVIKNRTENPEFISGIIIIAQSHIAIHYDTKTRLIYSDIFSCAPFDYRIVEDILSHLGKIISNSLVPRGTKHIYKVKSMVTDLELKASTQWQKNIGVNK